MKYSAIIWLVVISMFITTSCSKKTSSQKSKTPIAEIKDKKLLTNDKKKQTGNFTESLDKGSYNAKDLLPVTLITPDKTTGITATETNFLLEGNKAEGTGVWLKHTINETVISESLIISPNSSTTWSTSVTLKTAADDPDNMNTIAIYSLIDETRKSSATIVNVSLKLPKSCVINNGDCGDPQFYSCTNNAGAVPTCTDINECATNNGACGNSQFYSCANNAGAAPTCTDINECTTDNGGCGDSQFYSCTNNAGAAPACSDINECLTNNGSCGDPNSFVCSNNDGAAATCTAVIDVKRVLFIGADGIRPDVMDLPGVTTPHIDALKAKGIYSAEGQAGDVTSSGPGWSNLLTGVWRDKHNVASNTMTTNAYGSAAPYTNGTDYPDFIARIESIDSNYNTAWLQTWDGLNAMPAATLADNKFYKNYSTSNSDQETINLAKTWITDQDKNIHAMFVYFAMPDVVGHAHGFNPKIQQYKDAIELMDTQIGELITALESRTTYANENWLIVFSSDHGGSSSSLTGHGSNAPHDRNVPILLSGEKAITRTENGGGIHPYPHQVDIVTSIFTHMDITIDSNWGLDGRSILTESTKPVATFGSNLVENSDAEQQRGFLSQSFDAPIVGWHENYGGIPIVYDTPTYPTRSAHPNGGNSFFSGGMSAQSTMIQSIDVSHLTFTNSASFTLSADMGGYSSQNDSVQINLRFYDGEEYASIKWSDTTAYFFKGSKFWEYDIGNDEATTTDGLSIASEWQALNAFSGGSSNIDAIINYGDGKVYFFKGSEYIALDANTKAIVGNGPLIIADDWADLTHFIGGAKDIDAAFGNNQKAWFFKGSEYIEYDVDANTSALTAVTHSPRDISTPWNGLHIWSGHIDSALQWTGNTVGYFFKEGQYTKVNPTTKASLSDYPTNTSNSSWPKLEGWYASHRLVTLGPVTAANRNNQTKLMPMQTSGSIPSGTKTIEIELLFEVESGKSDGYIDNINLQLTE